MINIFKLSTLFGVVLILEGCGSNGESPVSKPSNVLLTVEGVIAKREMSSNLLRSTGTTLSNEEIEIQSELNGRITKILFEEGRPVSKGQLLVKLDNEEIQALLKKSILEQKLLSDKEVRQKRLLEIHGISQEEYDASRNAVEVVKAHISMLKAQIEKTEIKAPFSGVIGLRYVSEGAIISPGTVIASLQDFSPIKMDFSVPEKYASEINKNTKVQFTMEGSDELMSADVFAIEPKIDPVSRTLKIRALFSNKNEKILPGSFVNIIIQLGEAEPVIEIPTEALIPDISGAKVYTLKDGKAALTEVSTGLRDRTHIHIKSGLGEGDTVLTSGILQLKSGMPVQAKILNRDNNKGNKE